MKKAVFVSFMLILTSLVFAQAEPQESTAKPGEGGGAGIKAFGEKITIGISKGFDFLGDKFEAASDEISKRQLMDVTGKIKVKGKGESLTITIKDEENDKTYILKTASGTVQSMKKLALCKGHLVKVSGILNTETNVFSVVDYEVEDD